MEWLLSSAELDRAWWKVRMDFFSLKNVTYRIMIDCFSGLAKFSRLFNITSAALAANLSVHFGVPEQVISDTRLQFSCEVF